MHPCSYDSRSGFQIDRGGDAGVGKDVIANGDVKCNNLIFNKKPTFSEYNVLNRSF